MPRGVYKRITKRPKHTEETKRKISFSNKGKHNFEHTLESKKKIGQASKKLWKKNWYRQKMIKAVKQFNTGQFKKGFIPWNKGLKLNPSFKGKSKFGRMIRRKIRKEKCNWCNSTEDLQLDHIIALCNGGKNTKENCQVLCRKCNLIKRNTIDLVFLQLKQKRANSAES